MAIGTNDAIEKYGTQTTVTVAGGTASVANSTFSVAGDVVSGGFTNSDDAVMASMVGKFAFGTSPTANTVINLYARILEIDSTNSQELPTVNYPHKYLGSFPLRVQTAAQYTAIDIVLPNTVTSQKYGFYIENKSGQTLSAAWTLKLTPKAIGPHA